MCRRKVACSLCTLNTSQSFTLKGLPDLSRERRETERRYRVRVSRNNSVSLVGRTNLTHIVQEGEQWVVRNTNDSAQCIWRVNTDQRPFPLGRNVWRRCSSDEVIIG